MDIQALIHEIINKPTASIAIIVNLILIESLLSVDNAAVIATMVLDLSRAQRAKALSYGIVGAYIFRGLCLLFASFLIKIWWLKPLGGLYLIYLFVKYFITKAKGSNKHDQVDKQNSWFYNKIIKAVGPFWATVLLVEVMDLAFSIDNVFAAVAFTDNIVLVWIGVFIGILAMRLVAKGFVTLMEKFPFLETSAFVVLGVLGFKLAISVLEHFYPANAFAKFMGGHNADWMTSILTVGIFAVPLGTSLLFNFPARHKLPEKKDQ
ncbi:MAG: TerC family protein [Taibaiella sp.]|nr:TerC family protein [Taibaiella sp.]